MRRLPFTAVFSSPGTRGARGLGALTAALTGSLALAACQPGDGTPTQRVDSLQAPASLQVKEPPSDDQFCKPDDLPTKRRYRPGMERPPGGLEPDARIVITRDPDHPTVRWAFFRAKDQVVGWYLLRDTELGTFINEFHNPKKANVASAGATGRAEWDGANTSIEDLTLLPDCPSPPDAGGGTASLQQDAKGNDPRDSFHVTRVLFFSAWADYSAQIADENARVCESCPIPNPNPIPGKQ